MLTDDVKQAIQQAYSRFLEVNDWQPRLGQRQMIAEIARTLGNIASDAEGHRDESADNAHICVVEAGTGTGKTIAYCLATIPIAKKLEKTLVISTATVALQEQIVYKDLPAISRHADLPFDFALAKGRSRYLCPAKLDTQLEDASHDPTLALYPDEVPLVNDAQTTELFHSMAGEMAAGKWDGDRDSWPRHIEQSDWVKVTTDHNQCAGRRCAYISQCPFFKARDTLQGVDVVVANHDLVLADLSLGGGAILPEPEQALYVFDEGHHLADKAINHFAFHGRVQGTVKWLQQSGKSLASMAKVVGVIGSVGQQLEKITEITDATQSSLLQAYHWLEDSIDFDSGDDGQYQRSRRFRFPFGVVPDELQQQAEILSQQFLRLAGLWADVVEQLKDALDDDFTGTPKHEIELWYPAAGLSQARADSAFGLWRSFATPDEAGDLPTARWVALRDGSGENASGNIDFELCSSPIQSAHTLSDTLWKRAYGAVVTSATLTALNSFDRFCRQSGTPANASYLTIPSPFDFSRAVFCIPPLQVEPSDTKGHTDALVGFLQDHVDSQSGCLVLFSSRRQMEDVFYGLDRDWQKRILLQGDLSKQEMINEHKKRVDAGEGSVLFGLASFAEGVDLPGDYCRHVVIAKIPFAVPDDPVEEALAEWVEQGGGNAFMEISVPDAAMKLVQACGRLLRNENDSGTITLLDKRIVSKRYGKMMLESLPPFTRQLS